MIRGEMYHMVKKECFAGDDVTGSKKNKGKGLPVKMTERGALSIVDKTRAQRLGFNISRCKAMAAAVG